MKRDKKPMPIPKDSAYPSLRESKFDRRRFLAVLGGSVAGSALVSACYDSGILGRGKDRETDSGTDTGSESETGWDTNEPIAGDPPGPDFFHRRLPAQDFQTMYLGDGSEVVFAVATVFEAPLFEQMREDDLLLRIQEKLQTTHPTLTDYETGEGVDLVEESVKEALTKACLDEKGVEPHFVEVTFIVERLRHNEGLAGDAGDSNFEDPDSGMGR